MECKRKWGLLINAVGTLADRSVVETDELVACPEHLTTAEAAALPLAGLTAYRALFSKAKVKRGDHVLITGIGGGVALYALQFAVAAGAHVYVTSGSQDKIEDAKKLGAVGGVNYKDGKDFIHNRENTEESKYEKPIHSRQLHRGTEEVAER